MGTYGRFSRGVLGATLAAGAVTVTTTLPAAAALDVAKQAAANETAAQAAAARQQTAAGAPQQAAGGKVVIPRPGKALTSAEMAAMGCSRGGYGEAVGYADCTDDHKFKVRVWCTWAGEGLSDDWRKGHNWARCGIGSVNDVEIIWQ